MKKPSKKSRRINVLNNQKALHQGVLRTNREKNYSAKIKREGTRSSVIRIKAPKKFLLKGEENRNLMLSFMQNIKTALQENLNKVYVSFSLTDELHPCGTLFFRAHICNLIEKAGHRIGFGYPKNDVVGQLFQHIGLLDKMGLSNRYTVTAENVKHWHSVEGDVADTSGFKSLLNTYEKELGKPVTMGLYDSMSEAVTNSVQHAYKRDNSFNQKWWMFAQRQGDFLTVVIYDTGIGIPDSLRTKPGLTDYLQGRMLNYKSSDKSLLSLAVGSYRSSTKLAYRGKGLPEMMEFIKGTNVGGLLIHSRFGTYMYSASTKKETTKGFHHPLPGTLIQWTIPLSE